MKKRTLSLCGRGLLAPAVIASITWISSCGTGSSSDPIEPIDPDNPSGRDTTGVVFSVSNTHYKIASTTKTVLTDTTLNGLKSIWDTSDELALYSITTQKTYHMTQTSRDSLQPYLASFVATTPEEDVPETATYVMMYPYSSAADNDSIWHLTFDGQDGTLATLARSYDYCLGLAKGVRVSHHVTFGENQFNCNNPEQHVDDYTVGGLGHTESELFQKGNILFDNKVAMLRVCLVKQDPNAVETEKVVPLDSTDEIMKIEIDDTANRICRNAFMKKKDNLGTIYAADDDAFGDLVLSNGEEALRTTRISYADARDPASPYYCGSAAKVTVWGTTVYVAFCCPNFQDRPLPYPKRYVTLAPSFTITMRSGDIYYGFLKERTMREGHYYMTTALTCSKDPIEALLYTADWVEGGHFDEINTEF